jgi:uncharacterized protein with gpF-like domain
MSITIAPLPPEEALAYFRKKGLATTFDWQDTLKLQQDVSFTVAGIMQLDVLADIKEFIDESLEKGYTIEQFKSGLIPRLQEKGWWGEKEIENPETGKTRTVIITPYRLKTILETNSRAAYSEGQWARIQDNKDVFPLLIYVGNNSKEPRPSHSALNGLIAPVNAPIWAYIRPIKDFGCKCRIRALTAGQGAKLGYNPNSPLPPPTPMVEFVNKQTGEKRLIPEGVNPAFWHPGKTNLQALQETLKQRQKGV